MNAALHQAAATAKAAGDERSRGQVMADALVERVTGRTSADDVDVEVQVVITDRALFAGDEAPAHVPGYGPVPAGWVRALLTRDLAPAEPGPLQGPRPDQPAPQLAGPSVTGLMVTGREWRGCGCAGCTHIRAPAPWWRWSPRGGCSRPGYAAT